MKTIITPTYKDFFGSATETPEELLLDVPISILIAVVGVLNAELYLSQEENTVVQSNILKFLLHRQHPEVIRKIYSVLIAFSQKSESSVAIFSQHLNLAFLHFALTQQKEDLTKADTTTKQEFNIFKAYLLISEKEYSKITFLNDNDILAGYRKNTWPMLAVQSQLNQFNNYILDMVKAKCWFDFLEFKSDYGKYVKNFLKQNNSTNSWHYILNLASQLSGAWDSYSSSKLAPAFIKAEEPYDKVYRKISLDPDQYRKDFTDQRLNYNGLKSKPVYEFEKNSFIVVDWNMFSGKIFQGLLFDFYEHSGIETEFSTLLKFKNFIAENSTEGYLFRKLIKSIFHRKHDVVLFDERTGQGVPDAYVRIGSNILLFELKDAFSNAKTIESNDYEVIKNNIDQKFNSEKKGTGQLLKHITSLKELGFENQEINSKKLTIYPILLYTNNFYGLSGVSLYLQDEFRKKIESTDLPGSFKSIRRLAFFNINFLIQHLYILKTDRSALTRIIDSASKKLKGREKYYSKSPSVDILHKWNEDFYRLMIISVRQDKTGDDNFLKAVFDSLDLKQGL